MLQLEIVRVEEEDFIDTADAERGGVFAVRLLDDELAEWIEDVGLVPSSSVAWPPSQVGNRFLPNLEDALMRRLGLSWALVVVVLIVDDGDVVVVVLAVAVDEGDGEEEKWWMLESFVFNRIGFWVLLFLFFLFLLEPGEIGIGIGLWLLPLLCWCWCSDLKEEEEGKIMLGLACGAGDSCVGLTEVLGEEWDFLTCWTTLDAFVEKSVDLGEDDFIFNSWCMSITMVDLVQ